MRTRPAIARLLPSLTGVACAAPSGPAIPAWSTDIVVVQAVLITTGSTQTMWVSRGQSPDSTLTTVLRPFGPTPVRIEVRDTVGGVFVFAADPERPARFTADFTPVAGRRYDLVVDAGGRRVAGTVVVPTPVVLLEPAADTVVVPAGDSLRVRWTSGSSRHFAWTVSPLDSALWSRAPARELTRDTVASLPAFFFGTASVLWVLAMDAATWAYFNASPAPLERAIVGNLVGGAGVFGAMTAARVVVLGT